MTSLNWRVGVQSVCAAAGLAALVSAGLADTIRYSCATAAGVPMKVLSIDLSNPNVKITGQMARMGAGHAEPFDQMIRRARPTIAVTGTFFSDRSLIPIGDIVIDGKLAHFGGMGTALCLTEDNEVEFVRPERYRHQDWSRYDFVLCSGPRLVTNGVAYVEPWSEGFHDQHMLNRNGRVAVGVTADHRLVFVATRKRVYLSKLAKAMRALGVTDAINLDGGTSVGVYYKGRTIIRPSRWLTNLILVYDDRARYDQIKQSISPTRMRSAKR